MENILKELFSCDVSLHVSICPETYGLTLSEAWAAGLVPIVSDIGAFAERVIDGVNGVKIDVGSSSALVTAVLKLSKNKNLVRNLKLKDQAQKNLANTHALKIYRFFKSLASEDVASSYTKYQRIQLTKETILTNWASFYQNKKHPTRTKEKFIFKLKLGYQLIRDLAKTYLP